MQTIDSRESLLAAEDSSNALYYIGQDMRRQGCYEPYAEMVIRGETPKMAAMLASRKCAASKGTDSEFFRREHDRMASMPDETRSEIVAIAQKAGINTHGKCYNGQLGRYNDPAAWVSTTSDVREVAKQKGYSISGLVNVQGPEKDVRRREKKIAPDIKKRIMDQYRAADPKLDEKCRKSVKAVKELESRVVEAHARPVIN
jgi:hypothetical protein